MSTPKPDLPVSAAEVAMFAQLVAEELAMRQGEQRQPAREMVVHPASKGYAYHLIDVFGYVGVAFPFTLLGNAHADLTAALRFLDSHNVGYDLGPLVEATRARGLPVRLGPPPSKELSRPVKVIGLGETGGRAAEQVALSAWPGLEVWAIERDALALSRRQVPRRLLKRERDARPLPFLDEAEAIVVMGNLEEDADMMMPLALAAWGEGVPALGVASGGPPRPGSDVDEAFEVFWALEAMSLIGRFGSVSEGLAQVAMRLLGADVGAISQRIRRAKRQG